MTELNARACSTAALLAALAAAACLPFAALAQPRVGAGSTPPLRNGDYIVAVVNQELVTAVEVEQRLARARSEAGRSGARLPPAAELQKQVVDALIEERAMLSSARESGARVDDAEVDRALQTIAAQNQMSVEKLRDRLIADGSDLNTFRSTLRDQLMVERTREREVNGRIRITDAEIDRYLEQQRQATAAEPTVNIAQILVTLPEGASDAVVAERRARAEQALTRVSGGEAFEVVARELSEDSNRQRGGEIGLRPASRMPDLFVEAIKGLKTGAIAPAVVRSGAGFHVLKVLDAGDSTTPRVVQTRARHILLRPAAQLSQEQAVVRLAGYRRQIEGGSKTFEDMARQYSEDGSASQGGELGWATPGMMVPEFEQAMNRLAIGGLSQPVVSRFGVHLIQVLERRQVEVDVKQLREQARNALREQKFAEAYSEWTRDLRSRAYIEMREPPL